MSKKIGARKKINLMSTFIDEAKSYKKHRGYISKNLTIDAKTEIIESILARMPFKELWLVKCDDKTEILDGYNFITTINEYFSGEFALKNTKLFDNLEGKRYDDIPPSCKRTFLQSDYIITHTINASDESYELVFNMIRPDYYMYELGNVEKGYVNEVDARRITRIDVASYYDKDINSKILVKMSTTPGASGCHVIRSEYTVQQIISELHEYGLTFGEAGTGIYVRTDFLGVKHAD